MCDISDKVHKESDGYFMSRVGVVAGNIWYHMVSGYDLSTVLMVIVLVLFSCFVGAGWLFANLIML